MGKRIGQPRTHGKTILCIYLMHLKTSLETFRKSQKVLALTFDPVGVKLRELTFGGHISPLPPSLNRVNEQSLSDYHPLPQFNQR